MCNFKGMELHETAHIIENIFKLIRCTTVSSKVLDELVQENIISDEEKSNLVIIH